MKQSTTHEGLPLLEEVYNPIVLRSNDGEEVWICMRDSGFEMGYGGSTYSLKHNLLFKFGKSLPKRKKEFIEETSVTAPIQEELVEAPEPKKSYYLLRKERLIREGLLVEKKPRKKKKTK